MPCSVGLDRPSQRLLENKKQEKEQLVLHAGNSESRTRFLPSSHDVVVKTKVLGNFLSILILEPVVSGVKILFTKSSVTAVKRKFPNK